MIKHLKICGFTFNVVYKDAIVEEGNSCLGVCKSDSNTIEIRNGITKQRENEVILHESLHSISDIMNLDLTDNQVNALGVMLVEFMANNRGFIKKVLKEN
jgi:hypothetical protein